VDEDFQMELALSSGEEEPSVDIEEFLPNSSSELEESLRLLNNEQLTNEDALKLNAVSV